MKPESNVDHAFNPELRNDPERIQAQAEFDQFQATRPYTFEEKTVEDTDADLVFNPGLRNDPGRKIAQKSWETYLGPRPSSAMIDPKNHFDSQREHHKQQTLEEGAYENMGMTELARKLGAAELYDDKTTQDDILDVLLEKIDAHVAQAKQSHGSKHDENDDIHGAWLDRLMQVKDKFKQDALKFQHDTLMAEGNIDEAQSQAVANGSFESFFEADERKKTSPLPHRKQTQTADMSQKDDLDPIEAVGGGSEAEQLITPDPSQESSDKELDEIVGRLFGSSEPAKASTQQQATELPEQGNRDTAEDEIKHDDSAQSAADNSSGSDSVHVVDAVTPPPSFVEIVPEAPTPEADDDFELADWLQRKPEAADDEPVLVPGSIQDYLPRTSYSNLYDDVPTEHAGFAPSTEAETDQSVEITSETLELIQDEMMKAREDYETQLANYRNSSSIFSRRARKALATAQHRYQRMKDEYTKEYTTLALSAGAEAKDVTDSLNVAAAEDIKLLYKRQSLKYLNSFGDKVTQTQVDQEDGYNRSFQAAVDQLILELRDTGSALSPNQLEQMIDDEIEKQRKIRRGIGKSALAGAGISE